MIAAALLSSYFTYDPDPATLPPYWRLGARPSPVGTAALDSSDQSVLTLNEVTGVAACRSGINLVGPDQEVQWRSLGRMIVVAANPTAPAEERLRAKLAIEQGMRLDTGRRPYSNSLRVDPPMLSPRLVAAGVRVVEDHRQLQTFANSVYAVPGMLFTADGRLNAQNFPGAAAVDLQARLLRARGIRYVSLTKSGLLVSVVQQEARAIRRRVGDGPFAFPILQRHLVQAYRASGQISATPKTLRHGSSSSALGGVGAIRFGLSLAGDHLAIVEFSLYDFEAFSGLVATGERLESYVGRQTGRATKAGDGFLPIYSWDILPFVTLRDWEECIIPTLEEIVYTAYTDTELGIYPRALADIHNHIKLQFNDPNLEMLRRQLIADLARAGVPVEKIVIEPQGPHKLDPDEFDALTP
jgi:hypothetical protein